jgi:hypothetical protein
VCQIRRQADPVGRLSDAPVGLFIGKLIEYIEQINSQGKQDAKQNGELTRKPPFIYLFFILPLETFKPIERYSH